MQINKSTSGRLSRRDSKREQSSAKRAEAARRASSSYRKPADNKEQSVYEKPSTEDVLIDLYEDPFKKTKEEDEQLIINIDFSKPLEILGQIYRQLKELAHVVQSKITRENAKKAKAFVTRDKKTMAMSGVATIVLLLLVIGRFTFLEGGDSSGQVQGDQTEQSIEHNVSPDFKILIPNFRSEDELSIAKISPPGTPAAFAYVDIIGKEEIQVTQQQLPDRFKTNQDKEFEEFALGFAANQRIEGDDFTAYLGVSAQGPQSLIAIKNDLLILIKSKTIISNDLWSEYLASLQ